jgi:tetratricopeptide (TPR) repeat protein/serine phosphatase RsbU (regulator of sigma subunit)
VKIKHIFFSVPFILAAVLLSFSLSAQQHSIDSLLKVVKTAKTDTAKIHALRQLCWEFRANDPDKAFEYARDALKRSIDINDQLEKAQSLATLGTLHKNAGKYNQALDYNLKALKVYIERNDRLRMSNSYNNLGNIYLILGRNQQAIDSYQKSIDLCNELGIPLEAILPLNNMGEVYRKSGDMENATQCFTRALKLARELKDESMIVYCLSNMGYIYVMQEKYDSAFSYYNRSMNFNKRNKDFYSLSYDYDFMGIAFSAMEDYDNALEYIDSALAMIKDIDHPHALAEFYVEKGSVYRKAKNPGKAMESYNKALNINKELGLKIEMAKCLDSVGTVLFYDNNNIPKAIEIFTQELELSQEMGDSVGMANSHLQLGSLFRAIEKIPNAERHLLDAENISKAIKYNKVWSKTCQQLSELYAASDSAKLSVRYLELFDSLEMADYGKMKYKYDTAKMEKEAQLQELQLQQKQFQLYASIIIAILLFLLSLWIFNFYRQKKKANEQLEFANKEINHQKSIIEHKNKDIVDSINYAKRLQMAILPSDDDFKKILPDAFVFYNPKDIVSGDFYFLDQAGDTIFFAVADCTGHGVPGAFVSFVGHKALDHAISDLGLSDPGKILNSVRNEVEHTFDKNEKGEVKDGMDISLGVLNTKTGELHFAGAHHTLYRVTKNDEVTLLETKGNRQAVGAGQGKEPFTTQHITVKKGDMIYFSSDGFSDQFGGPEGKKFKTSQFKKLLLEIYDKPVAAQKELLAKAHTKWKGTHEQVDDVCVIGVQIV